MKPSMTEIIASIMSSHILDEYQSKDECLRNLLSIAFQSPEHWQSHEDISYSEQTVPAREMERIFRIRLGLIPDEKQVPVEEWAQVKQLKKATEDLVDYCVNHRDANIGGVLFNCSQHSYDVFWGITNQRFDMICVLFGKHIPSYAMRNNSSRPNP